MSLDKSSRPSCKTRDFEDVYGFGGRFANFLKSQGTSLKTFDTLDTCTETEPKEAPGQIFGPPEQNLEKKYTGNVVAGNPSVAFC